MASVFSKIISGEIPCYKITENKDFIAFLDINPNTQGHTLCVPKKEVNKILEMKKDHYLQLMEFSRKVGLALEKTIPCKRVGMSVIGLEVPHVHVHLIPINKMQDMTFATKVKMAPEEFLDLANAIQQNL
ncbi:MAG: HIT family protein [Flavobacteriales bacterium]